MAAVRDVKSLEARLERLEAKYTRLRIGFAVLASAALVACTAAAIGPEDTTVRAERFEVLGRDGEVVAILAGDFGHGWKGLRVGDFGEDSVAFFGAMPYAPDASGRGRYAPILHLESGVHPDRNIVALVSHEDSAQLAITNDARSILATLDPGETAIRIAGARGKDAPVAPDAEELAEPITRFEVRVDGERTSVQGAGASGDVLFRQP